VYRCALRSGSSRFCYKYVNADSEFSTCYPDILVKVSSKRLFIVETKGQEDLDMPLKMQRLKQWCEDINGVQADVVYDFVYVDQESFEKYKRTTFQQLADGFREYK
jgi:type III restriction enzyme